MDTTERKGTRPNTGVLVRDKNLVKREVVPVCVHYLGPGKTVGARTGWRCPACGKEKLEANAQKGVAGCWNERCEVPTTTDAIGIIAFFEGIDPRGRGFGQILEKGYEVLGLDTPGVPRAEGEARGRLQGEKHRPGRSGRGSPHEREGREGHRRDARAAQPGETAGTTSWRAAAGPFGEVPRAGDEENGVPGAAEESTRSFSGREEGASERVEIASHDEVVEGEVVEEGENADWAEDRPLTAYTQTRAGLRCRTEAWAMRRELEGAELCDAVYEALLELCPLEERDVRFWSRRGLSRATMREGRFGSITAKRARWAVKILSSRFGEEKLLSVPGFSKKAFGRVSFTLTEDYALIPYYDADMRLVTIEGRCVGGRAMAKYVSLRGSGPHLYVFPGLSPERLEAFCEGPIGAILATQEGIPVGAIKGFRNYKQPGPNGGPLPELLGVDFKGRRVPYIPDVDEPPQPAVTEAAPKAARCLAEAQNGRPALVFLPEGKDLDEWLLQIPKSERRAAFTDLLASQAVLLDGLPSEGEERRSRTPRVETGRGEEAPVATPQPARAEPEADGEEREVGLDRGFAGEVYGALLDFCPLHERDIKLWKRIGVPEELAREGRFGSITQKRARHALGKLIERFGAERLASVPGLRADHSGRVTLVLSGDYALIPYLDASGHVTAVEGFPVAGEQGKTTFSAQDPVLLSPPQDHLYVFPRWEAREIEAICEDVLGAIRSAAAGLPVGALRASRRATAAFGEETLPELAGTNFAGRTVLYVPRLRAGRPEQRVMALAPKAAERVIHRHGGEAAILAEPLGEGNPDLGERLLAIPEDERREAFDRLLKGAQMLGDAEERAFGKRRRPVTGERGDVARTPAAKGATRYPMPELPPRGLITGGEALVALVVAVACLLLLGGGSVLALRLVPDPLAPLAGSALAFALAVSSAAGLLAWWFKRQMRMKRADMLLGEIEH